MEKRSEINPEKGRKKRTSKKVSETKRKKAPISTVTIGTKEPEENDLKNREVSLDYIESGSHEAYELRRRVRTVIWEEEQRKLTYAVPTKFSYTEYLENPEVTPEHIKEIQKVYRKMMQTDEFYANKNQRFFCYCDAFLKAHQRHRYQESIDVCISGIYMENPDFQRDNITARYYSQISQAMLCLIADNYMQLKNYEGASMMYDYLMRCLDCRIYAPLPMPWKLEPYELGIYQYAAYQIGKIFDMGGYYEEALAFVDRGIRHAYKGHYMHYLSELVNLRSSILRHSDKNWESLMWDKFYLAIDGIKSVLKLDEQPEQKKENFLQE